MLFKSVNINNFRSLKNLQIKDLKLVNLLIGKNSCGKTSVLEALFLLIGANNPTLPISIQNLRQMSIHSGNDLKYLFNDFNISNTIDINAETANNKKMSLEISPLVGLFEVNNSFNNGENKDIFPQPSTTEVCNNDVMKGLHYKFTGVSGKSFDFNFNLASGRLPTNTPPPEVLGAYITPRNMLSMWHAVDRSIMNKSENEIVDVLKEISDDIIGIKMGANNSVYLDVKGKKELSPINVMGDGIAKVVFILATLRLMKNGILLIDEIENGLHFSSLKLLWKAIFKACQLYNVQILATTHSYECIKSFYDEYDSNKELGDGISLIRLDKKNNEFRVVSYDEENIKTAMENEMEVR
ncbi:MAG: AAA family ATPase [Endomicrobium sp.]|nr:AAA family ATPase [Endomicrobium sp.]